jgi:hypothetical protein
VATPAAAVAILGNTIKPTSFSFSQGGPAMTWPTISNRIYRVAYKNSLTDPSWTPADADIVANGATSSWVDRTANRPSQRFYTVAQLN